jgi:hypothetical protein
MKRITVFMMMALMTAQIHAASESKGEDAAATSRAVTSGTMPLEVFTGFLSDCIAPLLSPKETAALSETTMESRSLLGPINQKHMADHVVDAIVSGGTPRAGAIAQLRRLTDDVRQLLVVASLRAKFGDHPFKIHNTQVLAADMAAVCGCVDETDTVVGNILRNNPIIGQHVKNYYLLGTPDETRGRRAAIVESITPEETPEQRAAIVESITPKETPEQRAAIVRSIQTDYHTLDSALIDHHRALNEHHNDYVGPTYVTATIVELTTNMAAANAYFTAHPNVTLVLMAPEGDTLNLQRGNIPAELRKLSIVGYHVTTIGDYFLNDCTGLTTVDLTRLSKVTHIRAGFLYNCSELRALDLTPLSNVTQIGDYFLSNCRGLTALDLTLLSNITRIGNDFLHNCSRLTTIDLSPLSKVTSIGNVFLHGCSRLTTINLSPLSKVTSIGEVFLHDFLSLNAATRAAVKKFKAEVAARAAPAGGRPAGVATGRKGSAFPLALSRKRPTPTGPTTTGLG